MFIQIETTTRLSAEQLEKLVRSQLCGLADLPLDNLVVESDSYVEALESESQTMVTMLQRFARRIGELTDQRNRLWRENIALKRKGKQC